MKISKQINPFRTRVVPYFGLAAGLGLMAGFGHPMLVLGASMEPCLHSGQLLWLDRASYRNRNPAPGEVVVFRFRGATYVKRVFRGPGDPVHFLGGQGHWAQGPVRQADTQLLRQKLCGPRLSLIKLKTLRVPEGHVFVIGDNRQCSEDSRSFGPIPVESILGRATAPVELSAFQYYRLPSFGPPAVARGESAPEPRSNRFTSDGRTAS